MKEKLIEAKNELVRQLRRVSITATLIVHLLYIGYLSYSLIRGIGFKIINIALIIGTALFLIIYLILQLVENNRKKKLKTTKKYYKRCKLSTTLFTTGTAIYSIITAANSVSKFAMVFSIAGAVMLVIKIIIEFLSSILTRKVAERKEKRKAVRENKKMQKLIDQMEITEETCAISMDDFE